MWNMRDPCWTHVLPSLRSLHLRRWERTSREDAKRRSGGVWRPRARALLKITQKLLEITQKLLKSTRNHSKLLKINSKALKSTGNRSKLTQKHSKATQKQLKSTTTRNGSTVFRSHDTIHAAKRHKYKHVKTSKNKTWALGTHDKWLYVFYYEFVVNKIIPKKCGFLNIYTTRQCMGVARLYNKK